MATQGLVEIRRGCEVVCKIIAGCNGHYAKPLANALRGQDPQDLQRLHQLAMENQFGCRDCLVVLGPSDDFTLAASELHPRYRETFAIPGFNPRWVYGTAEYYETHDLGDIGMEEPCTNYS